MNIIHLFCWPTVKRHFFTSLAICSLFNPDSTAIHSVRRVGMGLLYRPSNFSYTYTYISCTSYPSTSLSNVADDVATVTRIANENAIFGGSSAIQSAFDRVTIRNGIASYSHCKIPLSFQLTLSIARVLLFFKAVASSKDGVEISSLIRAVHRFPVARI